MARFIGSISGQSRGGRVTRLGSPNSGLTVEANGWHGGVRVHLYARDGEDWADIWLTGGSDGTGAAALAMTVRVDAGPQAGASAYLKGAKP